MIYARIKIQRWKETPWVDHDLIENKLYPVHWVSNDGHQTAFRITDEVDYDLYCLVNGCAHLGYGDWELIEVE